MTSTGLARTLALPLLVAAAALTSGCHITNHDFHSEVRMEPVAIDALRTDIEAQEETLDDSDSSGLFDLTWVPFLYMNVDVFGRTDHEDEPIQPTGFVRADMRSFLPIFLAWRGGTTLYDEEGTPYEHRYERSFAWGLWKKEYSRIATVKGVRHEEDTRFLWFLHWGPDVYYEKDDDAGS